MHIGPCKSNRNMPFSWHETTRKRGGVGGASATGSKSSASWTYVVGGGANRRSRGKRGVELARSSTATWVAGTETQTSARSSAKAYAAAAQAFAADATAWCAHI